MKWGRTVEQVELERLRFHISQVGYQKRFAWIPIKLSSGEWLWLTDYYLESYYILRRRNEEDISSYWIGNKDRGSDLKAYEHEPVESKKQRELANKWLNYLKYLED